MRGKRQLVLYRGTNPGDVRRIRTGAKQWDSHLFASSSAKSASMYGKQIAVLRARKDAKILYEGTAKFRSVAKGISRKTNLLVYSGATATAAKAAGYDAVHYLRQGDVGTAIFNRAKFRIRGKV